MNATRRDALGAAAAFAATELAPGLFAAPVRRRSVSALDRPGIGSIGLRYQGTVDTVAAAAHGDVTALCDVDRDVLDQARASFGSTPAITGDYRALLARQDVDVVIIGTPDHWHAQMLLEAVRAGKDVYVEKPLTLTVGEGRTLLREVPKTGSVVQVGTWQRSDSRFRLAAELVRAGRIGALRKVTCTTDQNPAGGPFPARPVPPNLDWDLWQGPAPERAYLAERCHYTFRWWWDYAGGKMTDWGAHHVDVAQWAIDSPPVRIESTATLPTTPDGYQVPTRFAATVTYENGVVLEVKDEGRRGILFEGDGGRLFVNRGTVAGVAVDELASNPLPRDRFVLYDGDDPARPDRAGKLEAIASHMEDFFQCLRTRKQPISDLRSQHHSATTCHLCNISMRLGGETLDWDPRTERTGDPAADALLSRERRGEWQLG